MSPSSKKHTITEYGGFVRGESSGDDYNPLAGHTFLAKHTFDALESFILAQKSKTGAEAAELLSLSVKRGVGKVITAQNYVGVITMKDGTVIEILPKIHCGAVDMDTTKDIFLEMLRTLKDVPFKEFNASNLNIKRMDLLEIFISMFVSEAEALVKQGLKSFYNTVEENEFFFKGKLNVPQNIRHNHIHKERFYVQYDVRSVNRPENRLLKSTLLHLRKQTSDGGNRFKISRLLNSFDGVDVSTDYKADFSKCADDRSTSHYQKALSWCKIFLRGNGFTPFAGDEKTVAFLFPMETVFESYVAEKLRRIVRGYANIEMRTQDKRHCLFDKPDGAFKLRPDIVLKVDGADIIVDTKWKLLSEAKKNCGISQEDMYQMYAYGTRYNAKKVILLYPQPKGFKADILLKYTVNGGGLNVEVLFIDLWQPDEFIKKVKEVLDKALGLNPADTRA